MEKISDKNKEKLEMQCAVVASATTQTFSLNKTAALSMKLKDVSLSLQFLFYKLAPRRRS